MCLATDKTVNLRRREQALKVNKLTFVIRASDYSWNPGLPWRPLFPSGEGEGEERGRQLLPCHARQLFQGVGFGSWCLG